MTPPHPQHHESSPSPPSFHQLREALHQIPCEKIPTDYDEKRGDEEEGSHSRSSCVPSSLVASLSSFPATSTKNYSRTKEVGEIPSSRRSSGVLHHLQHPKEEALLVTLFGILMRRYVREPEIEIDLLTKDSSRMMGIPLHGIVSREELSIAQAVNLVQTMLCEAKPLTDLALEETDLTRQALFLSSPEEGAEGDDDDDEQQEKEAKKGKDSATALHLPNNWPTLAFNPPTNPFHPQFPLLATLDLMMIVDEVMGGFVLRYNARLYSMEMMQAMMRAWETLLQNTLGDGDDHHLLSTIKQQSISLVSSEDLYRMTVQWNQTDHTFEDTADLRGIHQLFEAQVDQDPSRVAVYGPSLVNERGIHQLFEAQVDQDPSRVAVYGPSLVDEEGKEEEECGDEDNDDDDEGGLKMYCQAWVEVSYGEMEDQANRLATYLIHNAHVRDRSIIALLLPRSPALYISMLAILKAGAAYLSIDPEYPHDRIAYMMKDSGAKIIITTQGLNPLRLPTSPSSSSSPVSPTSSSSSMKRGAKGGKKGGGKEGEEREKEKEVVALLLDDAGQAAEISRKSSARLKVSIDIDESCYIIYTSGSTGRPKGCQLSHANVLNLIQSEQAIYQVCSSDRVLQGFSTSFDASVEEIWMAFSNGATLVVGTPSIMRAGPDLPLLLHHLRITCLSTVPTLLSTMSISCPSSISSSPASNNNNRSNNHNSPTNPFDDEDQEAGGEGEGRMLPHLRLIITGGEACSRELVHRWSHPPYRRFFNTYGPTEATVIATYKECFPRPPSATTGTPSPPRNNSSSSSSNKTSKSKSNTSSSSNSRRRRRMSIGRPLHNYRCYIVDEDLNLLPPGAIGELVIAGVGVSSRGYLNLPDKTSAVFRPVPHHLHPVTYPLPPSTLLYMTGDLARYHSSDGEVEYCGRKDSQVKIRGYRVELSEIETVLMQVQPTLIKSAVVHLQGGEGGQGGGEGGGDMKKQLVAFIIPTQETLASKIDTSSILQAMREKLPTYMIPVHIQLLSSFPTLPSGKVDRRRLPYIQHHQVAAPSLPPPSTSSSPSHSQHQQLSSHSNSSSISSARPIPSPSSNLPRSININININNKPLHTSSPTRLLLPQHQQEKQRQGGGRGVTAAGEGPPFLPSSSTTSSTSTSAQQTIASAFEAILELPPNSLLSSSPSVYQSFFDLGGNSLSVSLLITRLRGQGYLGITTRDVYQQPTIQGLAQVIERLDRQMMMKRKLKLKMERQQPTNTTTTTSNTISLPTTPATLLNTPIPTTATSGQSTYLPTSSMHINIPTKAQLRKADAWQLLGMYFTAAYMGLNSLTIYILYFTYKDWPIKDLIPYLAGLSIVIIFAALLLNGFTKWLVLGKLKEGNYPLWGNYHLRYWFVQCMDDLFRSYYLLLLSGTPLLSLYYRVMGVKIQSVLGRGGVCIQSAVIDGYDLVEIGEGVTINCEVNISAVSIEGNFLRLRKVSIGKGVTLGERVVVEAGASIGAYSKIDAMSLIPSYAHIPPQEHWMGAPATFASRLATPGERLSEENGGQATGLLLSLAQCFWILFWIAMSSIYLLPFLSLVRAVPILNLTALESTGKLPTWIAICMSFVNLIWLFILLQVGLFALSSCIVAVLKRVLLWGMRDMRVYPLNSHYYFRRWAVDCMMSSLAYYTKQLRGSIYLPMWYRLMGSKVGRHAEISSFVHACADKLVMGDHVFVADDVVLGMPHIEEGMVTHERVRIGHRSFIGNASVVRTGTRVADDMLVGVQSLAPKYGEPKETYLGSPPMKIRRQELKQVEEQQPLLEGGGDARKNGDGNRDRAGGGVRGALGGGTVAGTGLRLSAGRTTANNSSNINSQTTYNPPLNLLCLRYVVEGVGFLILHLSLAITFSALYLVVTLSYQYLHDGVYVATLPLFMMCHAFVSAAITLFVKWTVIGRFEAGTYPLYGHYVWRTEFVERIEENVLQANTFPLITGTVWMQLFYQAMGVKMGQRAYLDHPCFCEPDLCSVGDYLSMERTATLQAHLFQDRVRTTGPIKIGNFCSIGPSSVVLLGGAMGDHSSLGSLSLVMRSEELPPHSKWHGLPAKPVDVDEEGGGRSYCVTGTGTKIEMLDEECGSVRGERRRMDAMIVGGGERAANSMAEFTILGEDDNDDEEEEEEEDEEGRGEGNDEEEEDEEASRLRDDEDERDKIESSISSSFAVPPSGKSRVSTLYEAAPSPDRHSKRKKGGMGLGKSSGSSSSESQYEVLVVVSKPKAGEVDEMETMEGRWSFHRAEQDDNV